MSRYVFDIESNGLLDTVSRMWVLVAIDIDTRQLHVFKEDDLGWQALFNKATYLTGHNICGYDLIVLEKLFKWKPPKTCKVRDTMIMSLIADYDRFGGAGHSLENWGVALGYPKIEFNDFSKYSEEMLVYCIRDVELTLKVLNEVSNELHNQKAAIERANEDPAPLFHYIEAEHYVARWFATANLHGWPFDIKRAKELFKTLEADMQKAYDALVPKLGTKTVPKDKVKGIVEVKTPKWTKAGFYDAHTANWFKIDPCSGFEGEERPIVGPYCRVEFLPLSLDSVADVKIFLYRHGWVPTEWNYNKDTKERTSPKITLDSLEFLGGDGKLYTDFLTTRSRYSILKTWIESTDENGMLHGNQMSIGTPSMRTTHSIIVNVPSGDAPWGKELRELFGVLPGWKFIGADSSGNQARGLAHYLGNQEYIDTLINGDIHTYNANIATKVLADMGIKHEVPRSVAKRLLYAFLFGASGTKLWSYIFGVSDETQGAKFKNGFTKAVPGFKELIEKLSAIYSKTKKYSRIGYIYSIAGNKIYVDSFHKLLVYLLQACEKATCSAALMLTMKTLEERNIPYIPLIYYHDELDFMTPEEYAYEAAEIAKNAFKEAPKLFGVNIMDGGVKVGANWYECH